LEPSLAGLQPGVLPLTPKPHTHAHPQCDSQELMVALPAFRAARFEWSVGESNPCFRLERPASWPLDERTVCAPQRKRPAVLRPPARACVVKSSGVSRLDGKATARSSNERYRGIRTRNSGLRASRIAAGLSCH